MTLPQSLTPLFKSWRMALLLAISLAALFWLQPSSPVRGLQMAVPLASLLMTVLVWLLCYKGMGQLSQPRSLNIVVAVIVGLFVLLKTEALTQGLSAALRAINGQNTSQAAASDVMWLGFSYIAFRLIHVLRDKASGRLPALNLPEFVTYVLFAPTLLAGPIDRAERFAKELRATFKPNWPDLLAGGQRLFIGAFKKFALADTLALIALNEHNASQATSAWGAWLLVYAYALRLYFDFSGYSDMAIGAARLVGLKLPENFNAPYLKPNLTVFWNNWHMTLSQWFRAYWFNPLSRWLRGRQLSTPTMILICQSSTMLLIGLWHGITWNFVAWGAWHAVGLFSHNRWADFAKQREWVLEGRAQQLAAVAGAIATFHFVALGWVWFALPSLALSWQVLGRLLGMPLG